jgi:3-oxoacyl-[acyl-carrier protein] reductase
VLCLPNEAFRSLFNGRSTMTSRRNILIGAAAIVTVATAKAQTTQAGGNNDLAGKRALVTEASHSIGAGIALADKDADVVITYLNSPDRASEVVRAIDAKGRRAFSVRADSGDPAAVRRSIHETVQVLGGVDILVNNVGISRGPPRAQMNFVDIEDVLNVNACSAVLASQAVIPHLSEGGRIITIGSCLAERVPYPNPTVYSMSKSALLAFTRSPAARFMTGSVMTVDAGFNA